MVKLSMHNRDYQLQESDWFLQLKVMQLTTECKDDYSVTWTDHTIDDFMEYMKTSTKLCLLTFPFDIGRNKMKLIVFSSKNVENPDKRGKYVFIELYQESLYF